MKKVWNWFSLNKNCLNSSVNWIDQKWVEIPSDKIDFLNWLKALNETLRRITTQEDDFQAKLNYMNGEIDELKLSTQMLSEENLILRTQVPGYFFN